MLDRSTILRDAHSRTRWARAQVVRISGKLDPYHVTFAWCLRGAWRAAKDAVREAAAAVALSALEEAEADVEIAATPRNIIARIDALRAYAETAPFTHAGREQRRALLIEADDLAQAARCIPFTAPEPACHAH